MNIISEMFFLAFSNTDIQFNIESFIWKTYSGNKIVLKARRVEFIDRHEFAMKSWNQRYPSLKSS